MTDEDRLDRLESLVETQQETIERERERIADLEREVGENGGDVPDDGNDAESADPPATADGETSAGDWLTRRSALKTGGLLGLLGFGTGFSAASAGSETNATTQTANPQGQVGTEDRPLRALYTETVDGRTVDAATDDEDATAVTGHATAAGVASETTGVEGIAAADADNGSSPEAIPAGVRGATNGSGVTYGVEGNAASPTGRGVVGFATSDGYAHDSVEDETIGVMGVTDRSDDQADLTDAVGVLGSSTADSGTTTGVVGRSESPDGVGVMGTDAHGDGIAVFSNGDAIVDGDQTVTGTVAADAVTATNDDQATTVDATNDSGTGGATAVEGEATDTSNENYGVVGRSSSEDDASAGVLGYNHAGTGLGQGVRGVTENGIAVEATNNAQTGFQLGLWANTVSDSGQAIHALASSSSGNVAGVLGRCNSPDGAGVEGRGVATNGDAIGVLGQTDSPDGYGIYSEDDTHSAGRIEAGDGVVHEQRGEPTTSDVADGEVMIYNSDDYSAGDLVYAINDGGTILTQPIAEKSGAS